MKVVTRNGEFERERAMDIDAPLYSSLKSFSRKRLNGTNLGLCSFWLSRKEDSDCRSPFLWCGCRSLL